MVWRHPKAAAIAARAARNVAAGLSIAAWIACANRANDPTLDRLLVAEDARPTTAQGLSPIFAGLRDTSTAIKTAAIRAVGRLQRPTFVDSISSFLSHPDQAVRIEAANAVAQSVQPGTDTSAVSHASRLLITRLSSAAADAERGVIARSIGRLPYASPTAAQDAAEQIARAVLPSDAKSTCERVVRRVQLPSGMSASLLFGVMHGTYSAARRARGLSCGATALALAALSFTTPRDSAVWVRELALLALQASNRTDAATVRAAAADADPRVRRLAMRIPRDLPAAAAVALVSGGLNDTAASVRVDAVRALTGLRAPQSCGLALGAMRDAAASVRSEAIDATAAACESRLAAPLLDTLVRRLPSDTMDAANGTWHAPARALVALARVNPPLATAQFPRFAQHPVWQVRAALAAAARIVADTAQLLQLLNDRDNNVREQTIALLAQLGPAARDQGIRRGLADSAYQVVLAAATAAKDAQTVEIQSLKVALDRLTARGQETSRDPRRELVERIAERGSAADSAALIPYVRDFDTLIARRAAEALSRWSGRAVAATPQPLALGAERLPDPAPNMLRITLSAASGGGVILVRLFPEEAHSTVARVARLAAAGYYNGRTLHRVVPNFVIQGGGPDANEYVGDGPFMRDELGLRSHTRGTLGISTRGRDTGDAQLFINLVDNFRLDHDYTVFGEVMDGMDVVDRIEAGAVMREVSVVPAAR